MTVVPSVSTCDGVNGAGWPSSQSASRAASSSVGRPPSTNWRRMPASSPGMAGSDTSSSWVPESLPRTSTSRGSIRPSAASVRASASKVSAGLRSSWPVA
jgi:hypothetical protein